MKIFITKYFSLMLLASAFAGSVNAARMMDDEQPRNSQVVYDEQSNMEERRGGGLSDCFSSCYECGCNPVYCGAFDLQIQGGVNPILWRQRDSFSVLNCLNLAPLGPLTPLFEIPKFSTFFKTPWIVGGQVGYAWSDNSRVYIEFNYSQAKGKNAVSLSSTNPVVTPVETYAFTLSKYKLFDAYVGARYYWDRWCDRVAFFLGGKIGLTHHKATSFSLVETSVTPPITFFATTAPTTSIFLRNTSVAGGANFGFDLCFCGNWSLVITGEVVASCGPRANSNLVIPVALGLEATNFIFGNIGTELRFPVTAGIRYSF